LKNIRHLHTTSPPPVSLPVASGDMGSTIVGTYGYMAPEQFTGQVSRHTQ